MITIHYCFETKGILLTRNAHFVPHINDCVRVLDIDLWVSKRTYLPESNEIIIDLVKK